jgi:hypothetical protein
MGESAGIEAKQAQKSQLEANRSRVKAIDKAIEKLDEKVWRKIARYSCRCLV